MIWIIAAGIGGVFLGIIITAIVVLNWLGKAFDAYTDAVMNHR